MKLLKIKQVSELSGLPVSAVKNLCRMECCKHVVHRFGGCTNSPIYIDWEEMQKIIRSGKAD